MSGCDLTFPTLCVLPTTTVYILHECVRLPADMLLCVLPIGSTACCTMFILLNNVEILLETVYNC